MLLTKDIAVIKQINAVRGDYSRGDWFKAVRLHPTEDNITTYMDDKAHTRVRQALAPGVSYSRSGYFIHLCKITYLHAMDAHDSARNN